MSVTHWLNAPCLLNAPCISPIVTEIEIIGLHTVFEKPTSRDISLEVNIGCDL